MNLVRAHSWILLRGPAQPGISVENELEADEPADEMDEGRQTHATEYRFITDEDVIEARTTCVDVGWIWMLSGPGRV